MDRESLAKKYIHGAGYEIGPGHFPWPNPNGATIQYVDRYTRAELLPVFPEKSREAIPETDILADGFWYTPPLPVDFVVNSHVLEHTPDPIGALNVWMRNLNVGGHLVMAVPNKTECFDRDRDVTTWDMLYEAAADPQKMLAFKMRQYVDWHQSKGLQGRELRDHVHKSVQTDAHVHFCVWDDLTFRDFIHKYVALHKHAALTALGKVGAEFFCVLRRQ